MKDQHSKELLIGKQKEMKKEPTRKTKNTTCPSITQRDNYTTGKRGHMHACMS